MEATPQDTPIELQQPQVTATPSPKVQSSSLEVARSETPATSQAASESDSTQPTTPSSIVPPRSVGSTTTVRPPGKIVPVVPAIPNLPSLSRPRKESVSATVLSSQSEAPQSELSNNAQSPVTSKAELSAEDRNDTTATPKPSSPQTKAAPKSWADLVRTKASASTLPLKVNPSTDNATVNGHPAAKSGSLPEVLSNFVVRGNDGDGKLEFLKPRGLVNTGNMCYMNSVS